MCNYSDSNLYSLQRLLKNQHVLANMKQSCSTLSSQSESFPKFPQLESIRNIIAIEKTNAGDKDEDEDEDESLLRCLVDFVKYGLNLN
jgi:hypothetical protein